MNTVEQRLKEVFQDVLGRDDFSLTAELKMKDIDGWDSLLHITLMGAVQDEFEITFSIEEMLEIETIGELLSSIQGKI